MSRSMVVGCLLAAVASLGIRPAAAEEETVRARRVLYNFDGDSCLWTKAGGKGPVEVGEQEVKRLIEEVAYPQSRVDTVLVCINAQVMYYPTEAGTMRGADSSDEERRQWPASEKQRHENLRRMFAGGVDPYAVMLAEARRRGREALLSFRMNDDHGDDFLRTAFMAKNPQWRLGEERYRGLGALDFGQEPVRSYVLSLIEEAVKRYDCDGLELDFNRFPAFFREADVEQRVAKMDSLVRQARAILDEVGKERGRRLVLAVRAPSNFGATPPTPHSARQIGCDIAAWAERKWIDFLTVSEFLHERGDLPVEEWKAAVPSIPVYFGIECARAGAEKNLTASDYRAAATRLIERGADGVYLFNFFTSRELGEAAYEPPFEVLADLGPALIGRQTQLLVDDLLVAEKRNVVRELGTVEKANDGRPIFTDGWFYGTVLHDEGKFKLWYRKPNGGGFGYCESADGLAFEHRADIEGIPFAGDYTLAVEIDPSAPPQRRFLAGFDAVGMAAGAAHSADGIHWTADNGGQPITFRAADSYNQILWDGKARLHRLFTRSDFGPAGGEAELRGTRSMIHTAWPARPTEWSLVRQWVFDREGAEEARRRQIYAVTCWIRHGVYFALLSVYEHPGDTSEGAATDKRTRHEKDVMNFYIAASRDGDWWDLHWVYSGQPLIPRGPAGAFDKDIVLPASTIVTHQDRHWLYYSGADERHGTEKTRFDRSHAIGLATLPLDRFVGLTAGEQEGVVISKPFRLEGQELVLNLDATGGVAAVEILDEQGTPWPGFGRQELATLTGASQLRFTPRWEGQDGVAALEGKVVRLKFTLKNASLYSFQVAGRGDGTN